MSAGPAPSWPGSRVLLGWWRELAEHRPRQMYVSRLLFHRLEALVRVHRSHTLDRWQQAFLRLASTRVPCGELVSTFSDLQMDRQLLGQLVRELADAGLLGRNGSGLWQMTSAGQHALTTGTLSLASEERRTFTFVDQTALGRPPHFVPLERSLSLQPTPLSTETADCTFDLACLEGCIRQTPEWKQRHRFPLDVEVLLSPRSDESPQANWSRVILDSLEQRTLVLIQAPGSVGGSTIVGFPVRTEGWTREPEPLLRLSEGWEEVLPDVTNEPAPQLWQQAWKAWAQPRGLPTVEVEMCRLERVDHRLLVHAPPRLIERLRVDRSDAIKQEAWLLAGEGRTRTALQIELQAL